MGEGFLSVARGAGMAVLAITAAATAAVKLLAATAKTDANLGSVAAAAGIAAQDLNDYEQVVQKLGGSAGDADAAIGSLARRMEGMKNGEPGDTPEILGKIAALSHTNLDMNKFMGEGTSAQMADTLDMLSKMTAKDRAYWGAKLGYSAEFLKLAAMSHDERTQALADTTKMSEQDIAAAKEWQEAWVTAELAWKNFWTKARTLVVQTMKPVYAWLEGEWTEYGASVIGILGKIEGGFITMFGKLKELGGKELAFIVALFSGSATDIENTWTAMWEQWKADFLGIVDWIKGAEPAVMEAMKKAFTSAMDWLTGRFHAITGAIADALAKIGIHIPSLVSSAAAAEPNGDHPAASPNGANPGAEPNGVHPGAEPNGVHPAANSRGAGGGGGSTAVPSGAGGNGTADADVAQLMRLGWTREQAIGIAANIHEESGGNERIHGDNGKAYGLAQWHADRQADFAAWAGHDIHQSTHEEQVAFIDQELRHGSETLAGRMLKAAQNVRDAAGTVARYYERPADKDGASTRRGAWAQQYAAAHPAERYAAQHNTTNSANHVNSTVSVGQVNIHTKATDAQGIAKDFNAKVRDQYQQAFYANHGLS
jgi:hypothetical protein